MLLTELSHLLLPVTAENPCGENQEDELLFIDILSARESDPDYLLNDEWAFSEPKQADWNKVYKLCETGLVERTKDLQLSCWLVEALTHHHHLSGLDHGIGFLTEFIQQFWLQCWPSLSEEGIQRRESILKRFDRDISQHLLTMPLLSHPDTSLVYWRNILSFEHRFNSNPNQREALIKKEGDLTLATYAERAKGFNPLELSQTQQLISLILHKLADIEHLYTSLTDQPDASLFAQVRLHLKDANEYLHRINHFLPNAFTTTPTNELHAFPEGMDQMQDSGAANYQHNQADSEEAHFTAHHQIPYLNAYQADETSHQATAITDRDVAITQMLLIAEFFRETEPSSPVPYLMERGARWAMMDIQEWLQEMLPNPESFNEINFILTGNHQ